LDHADVVLHDRLVTPEILELARREAHITDVGKTGFGPATSQGDINAMLCVHALKGAQVVRLKGGDPTLFGRLDDEIDACDAQGIAWSIIPGITAASAAVASIGQSLTKRGRNAAVRFLSGQDINGFADHDWTLLARPNEIVALYMSTASARFIQGRLLMHGAAAETPITLVENASRPNERVVTTTLADLAQCHQTHAFEGPVLSLYGLLPRAAAPALQHILQRDLA
jgi:uroporphyrin-III C-methyltransferase/precorrin-2 dehydrogenase/sirohydrochlorin ferrochelatase